MAKAETMLASNDRLMHEIIGHIYDAASDSRAWSKVLEDIALLTDSKSAVLLYQDHEVRHASTFASFGVDAKWLALYNEKYGAVDPALELIASVPAGELIATHIVDKAGKIYDSDTFKNFYQPQGMFHLAGSWLMRTPHRSALLGFQREKTKPAYEPETLALVKELVPHIQKALHIHRTHTEAFVKNDAFASGIDSMQMGVVFFDHHGLVNYCNKSAKAIIHQHPAIEMRNNMVYATSDESNRKLREAVAAATLANVQEIVTKPIAIGLKHPSIYTPLPALIMPIHQSDLSIYLSKGSAAAVMILTDPDRMQLTCPDLLATIYDLTKAEAEVAIALANALSPTEIAEEKGVKITTIRSQVQSIFAKIGVNTQAQLMKTLLNSPLASAKIESVLHGNVTSK